MKAPLDDDQGFATLGARLDIVEHEHQLPGNRIYYLAIPPALFAPTVNGLAHALDGEERHGTTVRPRDR